MNRITVIALNTFKENIRDKVLYNLVFFGLIMIGSAILLGTLSMGEQAKIIMDLGLAGINLFGVLIATGSRTSVFMGYLIGAGLMLAAAVVAGVWAVAAERRPLESVSRPLASVD